LSAEAVKVLKTLDFNNKKQIIRDIIGKVIVLERSGAEIWAYLPLPELLLATQKLGHEPISRNRWPA